MALTNEQIKEIRDGCEGVTGGDWFALQGRKYSRISSNAYATQGFYLSLASNLLHKDAAHIARLDPTTVRALCDMAEKCLKYESYTLEAMQESDGKYKDSHSELVKALRACVAELDSTINDQSVIDTARATLSKYDKEK
jgi:hypothetical protein